MRQLLDVSNLMAPLDVPELQAFGWPGQAVARMQGLDQLNVMELSGELRQCDGFIASLGCSFFCEREYIVYIYNV